MKLLSSENDSKIIISVDPATEIKIGTPLRLSVNIQGDVLWHVDQNNNNDQNDGLGIFPNDWSDKNTFLAKPNKAGIYTIFVITDNANVLSWAKCQITVTNGESEFKKVESFFSKYIFSIFRYLFKGNFLFYVLILLLGIGLSYEFRNGCTIPWNYPNPIPIPNPLPNPIPVPGVLIIYDSNVQLQQDQRDIISSKQIRDFLHSKNIDFRIYDLNVDLTNESKEWQTAMKHYLTSSNNHPENLPWIMTPKYEGKLPNNLNDTLNLLKDKS